MRISRRVLPVLAGALMLLLSVPALGAPITVNLRVEGSTNTLFEGPISVEGIPNPPGIITQLSPTAEPCDFKDDGKNKGEGPDAATPTAVLYKAAIASDLAFNAEWSSEYNDFYIKQVGNDIEGGPPEYPAWGYAVNYTTANVGGCQFQLAPGSEVLWAYNYFNLKHLLNLSGPSNVTAGIPFTVHVTDGQTGEPIPGAAIGELANGVTNTGSSSPTTNAAGNATVTLTQAGTVTLKATQVESVRSNGLTVNVGYEACPVSLSSSTSGCGGISPGVPAPKPPVVSDIAKVAGVKNGHVYSRRSAPRVLEGAVEIPFGGTLRQVRISLQRRYHGHCFDFNGSRESFVKTKKCGFAAFFSVGGSESFSYLLPARLPKGTYTYNIEAVNSADEPTKLVNGISHVVFRVK
jgi:hypothetical protein